MAYLISGLLKAVLLGLILRPIPKKGTALFNKALLVATIPFFLISLSGWLHSKVDLYLVEFNLSTAHLSKYQILVGAYIMLDAVSGFMVQPFSKHLYRLNEATISKMRRLLRWLALPLVLIGSGSIYLFLENFTAIRFDNSIYLLMTIGSIPPFFYMVDIFMLYRRKKEKQIMGLSFLGAFINLSIGLLLIPDYGIFGAVIGVCCSKWIMLLVPLLVKYDQKSNQLKVNT
jgi:O-antigen/teichoic acid export membrane protein